MELGLNRLPWYGQVGLFFGVAAAGVMAFYQFYVSTKQAELADRRMQLAALQSEIAKSLMIARKLPEFRKEVGDLQAKLASLQQIIPEQKDYADLGMRLQTLAQQSNLKVNSVKPGVAVTKQLHAEWPFTLELDGTYHNLAEFFDRVSKYPRIINISNIEITAKEKQGPNSTITADCVATTFVLLPAAKPPAPTPPQVAATTGNR